MRIRLWGKREHDLDKELRFHLDQQIEDYIADGLSPEEARRQAQIDFGGVPKIQEECRERRPLYWLNNLQRDIRYAVRTLGRAPGFTAVVVLTLALGIGANTAIFSVVNRLLLRPLAVDRPEELVGVYGGNVRAPYSVTSYPEYTDLRDHSEAFDGLAAYSNITVNWNAGDQTDLLSGTIVSGNYFDVLGVRPRLGRFFLPEEDRIPGDRAVVVVSSALWTNRFGADPTILGKFMQLRGRAFLIVGVAPADFSGTNPLASSDVWIPMMMQATVRPPSAGFSADMDPDLLGTRRRWLNVIGRIGENKSTEQAMAHLATIASQMAAAFPETNQGVTFSILPLSGIPPQIQGVAGSTAVLLMTIVALLLIIACANVANLLLARGLARRKEMATRMALGASRLRLLIESMSESIVLALMGGAVGVLMAMWATSALSRIPAALIGNDAVVDVGIDRRVLIFTLLISVLTGFLCGIFPAISVTGSNLVTKMKGGRLAFLRRSRYFNLRSALLISQVSLSLLLLIATGLFARSLQRTQAVEPGFDTDNLLLASLNINLLSYTQVQSSDFYRRVIESVGSIPGIESAALARIVPLSGSSRQTSISIDGEETSHGPMVRSDSTGPAIILAKPANEPPHLINLNIVSPEYFRTLRIPLLKGRNFGTDDITGAPRVAIVNESMAARFWPGRNAVGQRFQTPGQDAPVEIIGVAKDSKYGALREAPQPFAYLPLSQNHESGMSLHVRTNVSPTSVIKSVQSTIRQIEPNLPIVDVRTMNAQIGTALFPARLAATLLGVFGFFGLLLASVGLYGAMSYMTTRRTQEIGIRMALGANRTDVLRLVFKDAFVLVAIGILIGLAAAEALTRFLQGFLYGVSSTDPLTFLAVSLILAASGWIATFSPALSAIRINPVLAIRRE